MRETFYIIDDSGSRCRESRHRLKEGIGEVGEIATDKEGKGTEDTKDNPCQCYCQISITSIQIVLGISTENLQDRS